MCINFFFPLVLETELDIILNALDISGEKVSYCTAIFEKKSSIDNKEAILKKARELIERRKPVIPTSFDFYFETESKKKLYFEIKYTEKEFDAKKNKNSKEYLEKYKPKYEKIYQELAHGKIQEKYDNEESFLGHYQIMRNLIHVDQNSYVIFVVPEGNEPVYAQAKQAKDFVVEKYKENVKVITWDELYVVIEEHAHGFERKLKTHFEEFMKKYQLANIHQSTG